MNVVGTAEALVIAVDNGGTNTRVQARLGETVVGQVDYPTPHNYETAICMVAERATGLVDGKQIDAVGFAVAGKIKDGKIASAGELQAYGWVDKEFQSDVATVLSVDRENVVLLNDCVAATKSQQVHNRKVKSDSSGYVAAISTGFGGAGFDGEMLIADEPGHEFLKPGATCGCGQEGHVEAHISGSGIHRKHGVRAEDLPANLWEEVVADTVDAHVQLLQRLAEQGLEPRTMYYFGSVALKSGRMLPGISQGLRARAHLLKYVPNIALATHGDNSGLVGAGDAAVELAAS